MINGESEHCRIPKAPAAHEKTSSDSVWLVTRHTTSVGSMCWKVPFQQNLQCVLASVWPAACCASSAGSLCANVINYAKFLWKCRSMHLRFNLR